MISELQIFAVPADILQPRIGLRARPAGEDSWRPVPVARADSKGEHAHANGGCEGWAQLCASGIVEFEVRFEAPIQQFRIRPSLVDPVVATVDGHLARFRLDRPRYVVIESGPVRQPDAPTTPRFTLYLFLEPPDNEAPPAGAPHVKVLAPGFHQQQAFDPGIAKVLYLLPGVHEVEGQMVDLRPGITLYLCGGAYLRSYVRGEAADGSSIRGRGVIDGTGVACRSREWRDDGDAGFVFFRRGRGITIDGPIIYDSPFWNIVTFGTTGTTIRNHKAVTWRVNNDGVQPRSCNDLLVEHCFLKCADDCVAIKTRRTAGMLSRNLVFRDLVCWNDTPGNGVEIGHTSQADLLEEVRFERIHLVHCDGDGFAVSISLIDHCTVRNITYRDFYVEGVCNGEFRFWIGTSRYTTDSTRGHIHDVLVERFCMEGVPVRSVFAGADASHVVRSVVLRGVFAGAGTRQPQACPSLAAMNATTAYAQDIQIEGGPEHSLDSAPVGIRSEFNVELNCKCQNGRYIQR